MGRHAANHAVRQGAVAVGRPVLADEIEIAADAARRDDYTFGFDFELSDNVAGGLLAAFGIGGGKDFALGPGDAAIGGDKFGDAGLLRSNTGYEGCISRALVVECGKYLCKSGSGLRISFKAAYY